MPCGGCVGPPREVAFTGVWMIFARRVCVDPISPRSWPVARIPSAGLVCGPDDHEHRVSVRIDFGEWRRMWTRVALRPWPVHPTGLSRTLAPRIACDPGLLTRVPLWTGRRRWAGHKPRDAQVLWTRFGTSCRAVPCLGGPLGSVRGPDLDQQHARGDHRDACQHCWCQRLLEDHSGQHGRCRHPGCSPYAVGDA